MRKHSQPWLAFYGDDFTGSTDALEQLARAGVRTMLFLRSPTPAQVKQFHLQAVGVAGRTRSLAPAAMRAELRPALKQLRALGAAHVHYKVCSTFDSAPGIGSIGCVMDLAAPLFPAPYIPLLVGAPALGRYCLFGNLFARLGIGTAGAIHRLDRHPAISRHPITPMQEADLRQHLARQTKKTIALFDILNIALPAPAAIAALRQLLRTRPAAVLFDVLYPAQLERIGGWLAAANPRHSLFSIGSSGVEMALAAHWKKTGALPARTPALPRVQPAKQLLIGSGSCSPVTQQQISWALKNGFVEVPLSARALADGKTTHAEIRRAVAMTVQKLAAGHNVIVHTTRTGADPRVAAKLKHNPASILGTALGKVLRGALAQSPVPRLCLAGGDTSSFAARALGIEALSMIAPLVPGAPLCRAVASGSPVAGREVNFKGGQVGGENYFGILLSGKLKITIE